MESDAKITFTRPAGLYRDALRSYSLEVDGRALRSIKPGETVSLDVAPGHHTVQARISWTGSPQREVSLMPGEEARFRVEPAGTPQQIWQVVGRPRYLRITAE